MLIAARESFAAAARRRLPYDAEVEWLEFPTTSTAASAYILFLPNYTDVDGIGFYISAWVSTANKGANPLGISRSSDLSNVYSNYSFLAASNYFVVPVGILGGGNWGVSEKRTGDLEWETHITRQKDRTLTLRQNGNVVFNDTRQVTTQYSMADGAHFRINSPQWNNTAMAQHRIKHIIMYEYDAVVHDLIPVRFTNEQGVSEGAVYDRANPTVGMNPDGSARTDGLYRNRGTGAFTLGPDVTT